ncbi:hypothetical protein ACPB9J_33550 [Streptomyces lavendulocolor]|uniref:hypothetical protein n=1 Tax=Streptomyces lavendulocolor TaxID=67316 RepID=UPI003C30C085
MQPADVISGPCNDHLHDLCTWPPTPDHVLYCSCHCHQEARAMAAQPRATTRTTTRPARTPRDLAPTNHDPEPDTVEDTDAAEAQEIEAEGHYVTAELDGEEIRIVPPGAWRQSWQKALAQGQFDFFAEQVIHPEDLDLYFDIDPTNDQFEEFVADAASRSGESLGKSRGPARSSRRTRRR